MTMMSIMVGLGPFVQTVNFAVNGSNSLITKNTASNYAEGAWITNTSLGTWFANNGNSAQIVNKGQLFNPTIDDGPYGPNGNPGFIRYTFAGNGVTGYTKFEVRFNTHDDGFAQRRGIYNGAGGTYTISTGGNTTAWYDITSQMSGRVNYIECGNYGGGDGNRAPSGFLAVRIDDLLLIDPDYASYGGT